ncbi:MAG: UTP--glucose-1-phosphate uridylyltransferase GalU [Kiritimatiellia bacterium]
MGSITKAVIPAAGRGTRFLPATKAQPKEMLPIVDTPTIQYVVEEAVACGITDILIITGRDKRSIEDHFDRNLDLEMCLEKGNRQQVARDLRRISEMAHIHYVRQAEQKGLGDAILHARHHVDNEPFVVLLGDSVVHSETRPCVGQLVDCYEKVGGPVIGLEKVPREKVSRYGIMDGQRIGPRTFVLNDLVEKPAVEEAPSTYAVGGRYLLTPDIFKYLETTKPGKNGEIQLTDALRRQLGERPVFGYQYEGMRYDIGNRLDYLITQVEFGLRRDDLKGPFLSYLKRKLKTG